VNWQVVRDWKEQARYNTWTEAQARLLYSAISDTTNGVLLWIKGTLVIDEIEAGAELIHEFDKIFPLKVAFWLKASDEDSRYLYVASERIDDSTIRAAYGEVIRLLGQKPTPFLQPMRVKAISADNALAKAAVDVLDRYPGQLDIRFGGSLFGHLVVDDVYIYRPAVLSTTP
jgi:hypothetical protein